MKIEKSGNCWNVHWKMSEREWIDWNGGGECVTVMPLGSLVLWWVVSSGECVQPHHLYCFCALQGGLVLLDTADKLINSLITYIFFKGKCNLEGEKQSCLDGGQTLWYNWLLYNIDRNWQHPSELLE